MKIYSLVGYAALGSRLRRLADTFTTESEKIYELYGNELSPRWFPVFYMLTQLDEAGITELADAIGQSHASVSQVVRDMVKGGVAETRRGKADGRSSKVTLTQKGKALIPSLRLQCDDVALAVRQLFSESGSNLWSEMESLEYELSQKNLFQRVNEVRKYREGNEVKLIPYTSEYRSAFKSLNEAWITKYWKMEGSDYRALDNPKETIIENGGYIVIAVKDNQAVGTCALICLGDNTFELAKMAVDERVQGLGIGYMLGKHAIEQAKSMGALRIYLESNTTLEPAISLYRKLGFKRIPLKNSPYERCNIQMEYIL